MQHLYDQIARVAPTNATVLLLGESGTGKELAAQTIHDLSSRSAMSFLPVNCGAISPQLAESELFGHEKGSFTGAVRQHKGYFEQASGGTLFLDEITEMPSALQVKLLRVLDSGVFLRTGSTEPLQSDVRIIAASNRDPSEAMAGGNLRLDLYHRLNVFPLRLAPLRERGDDIAMLALQFLNEFNHLERSNKRLATDSLDSLNSYHWPGNVRELRNAIHRACILADHTINAALLIPDQYCPGHGCPTLSVGVGMSLAEVEQRFVVATLASCGGVKKRAAAMLGISMKTLYNRLAIAESAAGKVDLDSY